MNEVSWTNWAFVIFIFGLMSANAFCLGRIILQGWLRLSQKTNRSRYRTWGVEKDLVWGPQWKWLIFWGIVIAVGAAYTFAFALASTLLVTEDSGLGVGQVYDTFSYFFIAFLLGVAIEVQHLEDVQRKVKRFEGLREVFRSRFRPSDLLSVYESMKQAPPLFWEEYTQLPEEEVNEETNQKYRERAAPYRYNLSIRHNIIVIVVGVLALVLATLVAAKDVLL